MARDTQLQPKIKEHALKHSSSELSRLMTAAAISHSFRKMLLTNPAKALQKGYDGEQFHLTVAERQLVFSIKTKTLEDFAKQLIDKLAGQTKKNTTNS